MGRIHRVIAVAWVVGLAAVLPAWAENGPQTADAILDAFVELTMRSEFSAKPGTELKLARWTRPLTWSVLGNASDTVAGQIDAVLQRASELSGGAVRATRLEPTVLRPHGKPFEAADAPMRDAPNAGIHLLFDRRHEERPVIATFSSPGRVVVAAANVMVLYGGRGFLAKIARVLPGQPKSLGDSIETGVDDCMAYTWASANGEIDHNVVLVTAGLEPPVLSRCLWEELGQILGVRNDLADASFSIFTNRDAGKPQRWTAFDEGVIRLLYDPALKPGMTAAEVRMAARPLVAKYFGDPIK